MTQFYGLKIVTNPLMVEDGEPFQERRSWKERLFSLPWHPMMKTRTVVPKIPKKEAVQMDDGTLVMHPAMAEELTRYVRAHQGLRP